MKQESRASDVRLFCRLLIDSISILSLMHVPSLQVWAIPTTLMQCNWLGERVATVDVDRAIANVINNKEDAGWGPNAVFRFPTSGGTGAIWKGVAKLLPAANQVQYHGISISRVIIVTHTIMSQ